MVIDMKFSRFPFCLITLLLIFHLFLSPTLSLGQDAQRQKLSPGAEEVEREIGVESLFDRYYSLPESERSANGKMSQEALALREEITEAVLGTSLEVDGVVAEIDNEISDINEIRAYLESRRDRALTLNNIANFIIGGGTGVVGSALQIKESTATAGNIVGIVAGGISIVLSAIGLKQQRGGQKELGITPNLLAMLFDRKPE